MTDPVAAIAALIEACCEMENAHLRCTAEINPDQTNPITAEDNDPMAHAAFEGRVRVGGAWITEGRPALVALRKRDAARTALLTLLAASERRREEAEKLVAALEDAAHDAYQHWNDDEDSKVGKHLGAIAGDRGVLIELDLARDSVAALTPGGPDA